MGMMMALETRYEVRTQVTSSRPALRLPWMWGRETLTTLMSMTSMKVGTITVMATSHLFTTGVVGPSAMGDFSFRSFIRGQGQ